MVVASSVSWLENRCTDMGRAPFAVLVTVEIRNCAKPLEIDCSGSLYDFREKTADSHEWHQQEIFYFETLENQLIRVWIWEGGGIWEFGNLGIGNLGIGCHGNGSTSGYFACPGRFYLQSKMKLDMKYREKSHCLHRGGSVEFD